MLPMPKHRLLDALTVGLLSLAMLALPAVPAEAHYVAERVNTYFSHDNCEDTRSETSHGQSGGGYLRIDSIASRYNRALKWACMETYERPAGGHAVKGHFYKWTGSEWALCWQSKWSYNGTPTSRYWAYKDFGSYPDCGSGYYGNNGGGYHEHGGQWYGGWVWSGYHYLPA